MASQESLDRVQQLYVAYYGRPADQEGQAYWAERLDEEGEGAIINAFGNSEEYAALAEGQGNATLVNNVYLQAFGRNADPEGLAYYTGVLERGEKSLAEIATTIINAAGGIDKQTFDARVEAAAEYTAEFGAAEDYNLEAAKEAVANADPGIYIPELTEAIEALQAAEQAKAEFLEGSALENELVQEELGTNDNPSLTEIEAAVGDALDAAELELGSFGSLNQLNANLADAQDELSRVEAEIAGTPGLRRAIEQHQAAEAALEQAEQAQAVAVVELDAEVVRFNGLNENAVTVDTDTTSEDYGTATYEDNPLVVRDDDNNLVIADEAPNDLVGLEALLADIQAAVKAQEATAAAQEAVITTDEAVNKLGGSTLLGQLEDAQEGVTDAQQVLDDRAEAQSDVDALQELADELEGLNKAVIEANDAFGELDVTLVTDETPTAGNDLFIFADEDLTINADFGDEGQDLLFIGTGFTRVDLGEDDDLEAAAFGSSSELEIFFQQVNNDAVLYVESETFDGNHSSGFDGATITLTGVNVEDLQLENGYISIA